MKVREWMIPGLRGLGPDDSIRDALAMLLRHGLNGMPVVDAEEKLLGLLTLSDIRSRILPTQDELGKHPEYMQSPETMEERFAEVAQMTAGDLMVRKVTTVSPDTHLLQAAALMQSRHVKQLPVVDGERVVGTITVRDISWAFVIRRR